MQISRRPALWRTALVVFVGFLGFALSDRSSGVAAFPQRGASVTPQVPAGTVPTTGNTSQSPPIAVGQLQLSADRAAAFLEAQDQHLNYLPGEVLIRFKPGVTPDQQQRALDAALRSRPSVSGLRWVSTDLALLRDVTQPDSHVLAQQLAEQPEVQSAVPNYIRHRPIVQRRALATTDAVEHPAGVPNDPLYGAYQWNFAQLDMPDAWNINPGGSSSLIVATVDTGVTTVNGTFTFPLFTGSAIQNVNLRFSVSPDLTVAHFYKPWDFIFMPGGGPVLDFDGHGTHVSSTIAETTNNAAYLAGMAYNVQLMPVKACVGYWELMIANAQAGQPGFIPSDSSDCPDDAIILGIHYATDNGAKMINLSLGGPDPDDELRLAILYAVQHGVFVAMAGGNDYQNGNPIEYPAAYAPAIDGAMSVAATGKFMERAFYSSTGPYIEIAAPGGDDTDSSGQDQGFVWQVTLYFPDQDPSVLVPRFDRLQPIGYEGTSMATPHVAALAALLWSQGVNDPAAIEALIKKTAKDLGSPGRDDMFGYGLIQPRAALFGLGIIK